MSNDLEFKIKITTSADTSGARQTAADLNKLSQETESGGQAAVSSGISHRALHLIFKQVGEASRGLEVGLMAVSGIMMGSLTFGIYAASTAIKLLIGHFEKQKELALEAAKATVQFWTDVLQGNADARKAAEDYAEALQKIMSNVDALKQKETEEEGVLKRIAEQRLKILDAELQAELAGAKGDKEEEARINARYSRRKSDLELQNEQDEINLNKQHFAEQAADALKKERAAEAAEKAKEAGAPGRSEAVAAEARLPNLTAELAKLQAARMNPTELAALKEEVTRRAGESNYAANPAGGVSITAAGAARARLSEAQNAEKAYSTAQQDYVNAQADIERFKKGTADLAKAVEDATGHLNKSVTAARATSAKIAKAEAIHDMNMQAAGIISGIQAGTVIHAAGAPDNRLSRSVVSDIRAMEGLSQGQRMDSNQTEMINHLVAGLRAQGASQQTINNLLLEMKDMHVDAARKFQDIWAALKQVKGQIKNEASPP